jgi:DNA-directed RNA polymerase subunit RPC12/RpoP
MAVFICSRCGSMIESSSTPSGVGCPAGGSHMWYRVCNNGGITPKPGTKAYQCKKCGKIVYCNTTPAGVGCPAGGSHIWIKL